MVLVSKVELGAGLVRVWMPRFRPSDERHGSQVFTQAKKKLQKHVKPLLTDQTRLFIT